jgi:hypothetical protein
LSLFTEYALSGKLFFLGYFFILFGVFCSFFLHPKIVLREDFKKIKLLLEIPTYLVTLLGVVAISLSYTPVSIFIFQLMNVALFTLFLTLRFYSKVTALFINILRIIIVGLCFLSMSTERQYLIPPPLPVSHHDLLYVLGDELSMSQKEKNWTDIIHDKHNIDILGYKFAGATVQAYLDQAQSMKIENSVVIIALGLNEMQRGVPVKEFKDMLRRLLGTLQAKGRIIVMLELPAPPFNTGYCTAQRELMRRYNVHLIPKRNIGMLLAKYKQNFVSKKSATIGTTLSPAGQKELARIIWHYIGPAFSKQQNKKE